MLALETTASIADHRLVIYDVALPAHAERACVIVMWESPNQLGVARHRQFWQGWMPCLTSSRTRSRSRRASGRETDGYSPMV